MRRFIRCVNLLTSFLLLLTMTACWNYREVDRMAIVAGVAVDKGTQAKYKTTIEIIEISHDNEVKPKSKIISSEGDAMMEAVRNAISVAGKRLYWSHAKVIIISQEVAKDGVAKILDWYSRDTETRTDVRLLISGEKTAGEIFTEPEANSDIISVTMHETFKNQKSLSKAPDVEIWRFLSKLVSPGVSPVAAVVKLKEEGGKKIPDISGTAVFRQDQLIGFLNGAETFDMQMIQDNVEGGILVQKEKGQEDETVISLEIFNNKTKIEPMTDQDKKIEISVKTKTDVAIDEISGTTNYTEDGMREKLIEDTENTLKKELEDNIKYVQSEFGTDVYGFGNKIYQDYPDVWKTLSGNWPALFKDLTVTVECNITIRNSAMNADIVTVGD